MAVFFSVHSLRSCLLIVALIFSGQSSSLLADSLVPLSPPQQLLKKMAAANRELSYKGLFTYEHGGAISTMQVIHALRNGLVSERLIHLNGKKRELYRHGRESSCKKPSDTLLSGLSPGLSAGSDIFFSNFYDIIMKGDGRVAGRNVDILHLVPKDKYRYGYVISLDRETGLLLQSMVIGSNKQVLERFQFVSIELGAQFEDEDLLPREKDYLVVSPDADPCADLPKSGASSAWVAKWLPPGFVQSGYLPSTDRQPETLIYTDGLAVFSVFIENKRNDIPEIQGQRGATVAILFDKQVANRIYAVCVVGEIPAVTANMIAQGLQYDLESD